MSDRGSDSRTDTPNLTFAGRNIPFGSSIDILGVTFSRDGNFQQQVGWYAAFRDHLVEWSALHQFHDQKVRAS